MGLLNRLFRKKKEKQPPLPEKRQRASTQPNPTGNQSRQLRGYDPQPILRFTDHDQWTFSDAYKGLLIMGATGSGKTSGSGQTIAKQFLRYGMGGIVLTDKPSESKLWVQYAKETGRFSDLVLFNPDNSYRFNFIDYETRRPGRGAGLANNIVSIFKTVMDVGGNSGGRTNEEFWNNELDKILLNAVDLCIMAYDRLTLKDIKDVVTQAPRSQDQFDSEHWRSQSKCYDALKRVYHKANSNRLSHEEIEDYQELEQYFTGEFLNLAGKTRSIVESSFTGFFNRLGRRPNRTLFCTDTNINPEDTLKGKIIVMDLPVKEFNEEGQTAQKLMKYMWQRAIERRDIYPSKRPVFLWADEAQNFILDHDKTFQTTARSSKVCTVYLTQNLPNAFTAAGPGSDGENTIYGLFGNLTTKIFHANDCPKTNEYAANLIGKKQVWRDNYGQSYGSNASSFNTGASESYDYIVRPDDFKKLRTGGREHQCVVDGYLVETGKTWVGTGASHIKLHFLQNL